MNDSHTLIAGKVDSGKTVMMVQPDLLLNKNSDLISAWKNSTMNVPDTAPPTFTGNKENKE